MQKNYCLVKPSEHQKTFSKFKQLIFKRNVNGALRLHTSNMSNGILPLSDESLEFLQTKHSKEKTANTEALLPGRKKLIHSVVFDDINEGLV